MNYQKHYDLLIARAQARSRPEGYVERHHILPRCMGGGNAPANIAVLTAREHFIAHLLLVRCYPEITGLVYAAHRLAHAGKVRSRTYSWLRTKHAQVTSERMKGQKHSCGRVMKPEQKEKLRAANLGKKHTSETRARIAAAGVGRIKSPETIAKSRSAQLGKTHSQATREKMRQTNTGKTLRIETREKISMSLRAGNHTSVWKGKTLSVATREKMSAAHIGNKSNTGRTLTLEHRAAIGKSGKGRVVSPETRAATSLAMVEIWAKRRAAKQQQPIA